MRCKFWLKFGYIFSKEEERERERDNVGGKRGWEVAGKLGQMYDEQERVRIMRNKG